MAGFYTKRYPEVDARRLNYLRPWDNANNNYVYDVSKIEILREDTQDMSILTQNFNTILRRYKIYNNGMNFTPDCRGNYYNPASLNFKYASILIDQESTFAFGKPCSIKMISTKANSTMNEQEIHDFNVQKKLLSSVLRDNMFSSECLRAFRDCVIAGRVAFVLNFDENGVQLTGLSPLEFLYETSDENSTILNWFTMISIVNESVDPQESRILKKKYYMDYLANGQRRCFIDEILYNGGGDVIERLKIHEATEFDYIPAVVICNNSLLTDRVGRSDIESIQYYEEWYSMLSNSNIDSARKAMHPVWYTIDADREGVKEFELGPGAFWDIQTREDSSMEPMKQAQTGLLETSMNNSEAVNDTLKRIKDTMYAAIGVPLIDLEAMVGTITSGKALKALYWNLIMRIEGKMTVWEPSLSKLMQMIVEGCKLYPASREKYIGNETYNYTDYTVEIKNKFPIPDEDKEDMTLDMQRVSANTMSRRQFIRKWDDDNNENANAQFNEIVQEQDALSDARTYVNSQEGNYSPDAPMVGTINTL